MIARERGLGPLAEAILADRRDAARDAGRGLPDRRGARREGGARRRARHPDRGARRGRGAARPAARASCSASGVVTARVVKGQEEKGAKFSDYFAHGETWAGVPSHRALAMMRGANEGVLTLDIGPDPSRACRGSRRWSRPRSASPATLPGDRWLTEVGALGLAGEARAVDDARPDGRAARAGAGGGDPGLRPQPQATCCWPRPPARAPTMGLDPGMRTGVKVAVVDATGKLLATDTVYPFQPRNDVRGAQAALARADPPARGRADRHRQRHGEPRDRAAGRRDARATCRAAEADQGGRLGGRRLGLFGLGAGGEGVPGPRRVAARRRLDRAAAAGPAGRAGQDRAEGDRRRPVPARRRPAPARPLARGGGRGRGERGRRRSQHRLRAAARARVGPRAVARRGDRRPPRRRRAPSAAARSCSRCRASGRAPSSNARASCASATATSRSTPRRCIRRPTASPGGSSPPAAGICAR